MVKESCRYFQNLIFLQPSFPQSLVSLVANVAESGGGQLVMEVKRKQIYSLGSGLSNEESGSLTRFQSFNDVKREPAVMCHTQQ